MCGSAFTGLLSSGYIDWEAMLFSLAMLICLMEWAATKKLTELGFAGVFAGLAFSTKYTAGFVSLPAALVILLASRNHFSLKELARKFLLFGGAALAVSLPWLAKNALATGNPFYPLFIPAGAMDTIRLSLLQNQPVQDWSRLILLPWQITVWGIDGRTGFGWSIGPLLLGLSPLAMIHWKNYNQFQQRALGIGATIVLSTFLLWAVGSQFSLHLLETRYYFPNFTAWAMLCGAGFFTVSQIEFRGVRVKFILGAFILLALGFNAFSVVENTVNAHPLKALLGDESREAYVENSLGAYEPAMLAVQALPEGAHVLLLWEARGYGCLLRCDSDEIIDRWRHDWDAYRNPDQIIAEWKSQGYTHVLLNHAGKDFIATSDPLALPPDIEKGLDATLARLTLSKSLGGIYEIYTLP